MDMRTKPVQDKYLAACLRDIGATCAVCQKQRYVVGYLGPDMVPVYDHHPMTHITPLLG